MRENEKERKIEDLSEQEEKQTEEKIRQRAEDVEIPASLEPEAVEKMLETRKKKKSKSYRWKHVSAAAAACVCLVVGAVGYGNMHEGKSDRSETAADGKMDEKQNPGKIPLAKNYDEIKTYLKENEKQAKERNVFGGTGDAYMKDKAMFESDTGATSGGNYSDTNVRQEGVAEADTVKTDGKNLYILSNQTVKIVDASQAEMKELASITLNENCYISEIFVSDHRLVLLYGESRYEDEETESGGNYKEYTCAAVYDVTDPSNPKEAGVISQSGQYHTMREKDGYVYLISDFYTYYDSSVSTENDYIPQVQGDLLRAEDIYMPQGTIGSQYTVVSAFALSDPTVKLQTKAIFGNAGMCYVSENNIYITEECYGKNDSEKIRTSIRKIAYGNGTLDAVAQTKIDGVLNDSFSIDEYNGYLRIVATVLPNTYNDQIMPIPYKGAEGNAVEDSAAANSEAVETNALYVLDENLEMTGSIQNLAKEETIHSARFMGDIVYFVTFKQIDPLFSADLSDPAAPKIIGELKIPGFSDYLHPYGEGKLLGIGMSVDEDGMTTEGVKLSMFDISDPVNVKETATFVLENVLSTDAGYNYKAVFADAEKNLFGFAAYGDSIEYKMFSYDEAEGFKEVFSKEIINYGNVRGLYIEDTFYLVAGNTVESFAMNGFQKIDDIVL